MEISRRSTLGLGLAGSLSLTGCTNRLASVSSGFPASDSTLTPQERARDEAFWKSVADQYDKPADIIQLENANWGVMSKPVQAEYFANTEMVNRESSYYQRRDYWPDMQPILQQTANLLGVSPDEIVFTRGATEALQALIGGYNKLGPGDTVMYCDLDYPSMVSAMTWLKERRGVDVIKFNMPEPATRESVLAAYEAALEANPKVKLLLTTHVGHRTGLAIPMAEITEMAEARGVDVICDAAHSFGQIDFKIPDLKAPFVGINMHKWVGAPIGIGLAYIRRDRLEAIDPYMGEGPTDPAIRSRIHSGTVNFAAFLTLPSVIDFHDAIGVANKDARLKYLRGLWAEPLRDHPGVDILTPNDPTMHGGITSFRLTGKTSPEENISLAKRFLDEFGIFTVHRTGLAHGACVRVAPSYFNTPSDVDALRAAILEIASTA
ncbi:MAG: aminotransferase [Ponticaulis sp.]|nr:aminotransferase [Ponticaulis sp.]|tara:strand:+ start:35246 stop:36550 length:1305 start_codon:yes stop_codon:yes gene_type:complete